MVCLYREVKEHRVSGCHWAKATISPGHSCLLVRVKMRKLKEDADKKVLFKKKVRDETRFLFSIVVAVIFFYGTVFQVPAALLSLPGPLPVAFFPAQTASAEVPGLEDYTTYGELLCLAENMSENHPDIVAVETIGHSWMGRDILAFHVTDNPNVDENEPGVLVVGNIHGDELLSGEAVLDYMKDLVYGYGSDSEATYLINNRDIWFIPVLNPDGRELSLNGTPWRKNCRDNDGDGVFETDTDGVDLNRNFDMHWGEGDRVSTTPSSDTYIGPSPFSEPETRCLRDFVQNHSFTLAVSYHSYGKKVLYPWGYAYTTPPEEDVLKALAGETAHKSGDGWSYGEASDPSIGMYSAGGDACDWLYDRGVYSFTVELGDSNMPQDPHTEAREHEHGFRFLLRAAGDPAGYARNDWTVAVYMCADNNLMSAAMDDLNEMEAAGPGENSSVVVLFDGDSTGDSWVYEIEKDHSGYNSQVVSEKTFPPDVIPPSGECDMSDPSTLSSFAVWAFKEHPARHRMLVIWGHGYGIFKGVCDDKNRWMTVWELRDALEDAVSHLGGEKFDIIGFDTCLMGNAEVVIELRDVADVVVFSQDEEPEDGWDYVSVVENISSTPALTARSLAEAIVNGYLVSYPDQPSYLTISAVNVSFFTRAVLPLWDTLGEVFLSEYYWSQSAFENASAGADHYMASGDMVDFVSYINGLAADGGTSESLGSFLRSVSENISTSILAEGHSSSHRATSGLSVYLPAYHYTTAYDNLTMSSRPWGKFCKYISDPVPVPHIKHTPPADLKPGETTMIGAEIADDNLASAYVVYSINGGEENMEYLNLSLLINTGAGNSTKSSILTYAASGYLPAIGEGDSVSYRIYAEDGDGFVACYPPLYEKPVEIKVAGGQNASQGGGTTHPGGPNLDIAVYNMSARVSGSLVTVYWTMYLSGDAGMSVNVSLFVNGALLPDLNQTIYVEPGNEVRSWRNLDMAAFPSLKGKNATVSVVADPDNRIKEWNETNNAVETSISGGEDKTGDANETETGTSPGTADNNSTAEDTGDMGGDGWQEGGGGVEGTFTGNTGNEETTDNTGQQAAWRISTTQLVAYLAVIFIVSIVLGVYLVRFLSRGKI